MKKSVIGGLIVVSGLLLSCSGQENERKSDIYGGSFKMAMNEKPASLFPQSGSDIYSSMVVSQIHDGLVKFDATTLEIVPAIAKSWDQNADNTEYVFNLNDNVFFHDDPCFSGGNGRKVVAEDFRYSFELLCSHMKDDEWDAIYEFDNEIKGVKEFINGEADHISGVEVVDDLTLKIHLLKSSPNFIYKLAYSVMSVIAKEAYDKYGMDMKVGAGAFVYDASSETEDRIVLLRNKNYYARDSANHQLPYLDSAEIKFITTTTAQLEAFRSDELSILQELPPKKISEEITGEIDQYQAKPPKRKIERPHQLSTMFYELNMTKEHFQDPKVRKALAYAVNRKKVVEEVLSNQAFMPGYYGVTPPIPEFENYDTSLIGGYRYNPELAKQLLAEAGYPNGEGFPTLVMKVDEGGAKHYKVAKTVTAEWQKTLGITVNLDIVSFAEKLEDAKFARADIHRAGWTAEYPSPESFLNMFYGKNVPTSLDEASNRNTTRYQNEEFDEYYLEGITANKKADRYAAFANAEHRMIDDCPIIVMWYHEDYNLYHTYVRNYHPNALQFIDMSKIYFKQLTEEEYKSGN